MPNFDRRKEIDLRGDRFESEARLSDVNKLTAGGDGRHIKEKIYTCANCHKLFQEKSRYCPRCDTKSMNRIVPIPESERQKLKDKKIAGIQARFR